MADRGRGDQAAGSPLPPATLDACLAVTLCCGRRLFSEFDDLPAHRVLSALAVVATPLGNYANLRPDMVDSIAQRLPASKSPLARYLIVREVWADVILASPAEFACENGNTVATNTILIREEIARVARVAFEAASRSQKKVTSVIRPTCWKHRVFGDECTRFH